MKPPLKPRHHRRSRGAALTFTVLLLDGALVAAEPAVPPFVAPKNPPAGDELDLFADIPVVISGTRQQTSLILSPVPVSVVTSDDIHDGAATTIAEAVQFVPGVDYLQINRNVQAVGVRGLHGTFSDRMLTLINGRNADNNAYGGSQFPRLPILLADIDHIEVVRGPGGAVWGPNAFNGVLNIITKEPEDMLGLFGSATVTHHGDRYGQARWCDSVGDWSWRISLGGRGVRSSADALGDDAIIDDDWSRTTISDNELLWRASPTTKVRVGLGYARGDGGSYEIVGYENPRDMTFWNLRGFARVDQQLGDEMHMQVQWYRNQDRYDLSTFGDTRSREDVIEGQLDLGTIGGHQFSFGVEARRINIDMVDSGDPNQVSLVNNPYREHRAGAYLVDSWKATTALTIEGQIRGDRYTGTGNDWAGRLAGLYSLDAEHHRVIRLATAKSYRTPLPLIRDSQASHPLLGSPLTVILLPSNGLRNEELWSIEAGYTHQLTDGVMARWDSYYQRYEHLVGYRITRSPTTITAQADNIDGATGYGSELELSWSGSAGRISAWYALQYLDTDENPQSLRAFEPSRHKVGATGHLDLSHGFAANVQYRYSSLTTDADGISIVRAPPVHRLDLNVAWRFDRARGELMLGVEDVTNTRLEAVNGTGSFTDHDTPGRTFFVRGEYGF